MESGPDGAKLNEDGKRLLELINPRYVGKEHLYATSQCFMCGRPKKACGRMLKSLPSAVRKTSKFRKMKEDTLKRMMIDNEKEMIEISRDHSLLVGIAEASLKAVQCRAVSDLLREIWRKDGRPIEPEELPSQLLSVESQCWSRVAQYYRLRGAASHVWSQAAAKTCVSVCETQFGGWTEGSGLHLFSDHPNLCVARLHYAHTILCGMAGKRDLKAALKIIMDTRNALYAFSAAEKVSNAAAHVNPLVQHRERFKESLGRLIGRRAFRFLVHTACLLTHI